MLKQYLILLLNTIFFIQVVMVHVARSAAVGALVPAILVGGCSSPGGMVGETAMGDTNSSPAERRMCEQSKALQGSVWKELAAGLPALSRRRLQYGHDILELQVVANNVSVQNLYLMHKVDKRRSADVQRRYKMGKATESEVTRAVGRESAAHPAYSGVS
jgi:hypothetical protein